MNGPNVRRARQPDEELVVPVGMEKIELRPVNSAKRPGEPERSQTPPRVHPSMLVTRIVTWLIGTEDRHLLTTGHKFVGERVDLVSDADLAAAREVEGRDRYPERSIRGAHRRTTRS